FLIPAFFIKSAIFCREPLVLPPQRPSYDPVIPPPEVAPQERESCIITSAVISGLFNLVAAFCATSAIASSSSSLPITRCIERTASTCFSETLEEPDGATPPPLGRTRAAPPPEDGA